MMRKISFFIMLSFTISLYAAAEENNLTLISNGKSQFCIYHTGNCDPSVKAAASELQYYIQKVTGVKLPLTQKLPEKNFISLGNNQALKDAGLNTSGITVDGYLTAIEKDRIFIAGKDETEIASSKGTLFGTYEFIEKYLGVRWFMPGEIGEYFIPQNKIILPLCKYTDNPVFKWRHMPYIKNENPDVKKWMLRMKINQESYTNNIQHGHIWNYCFKEKDYKEHPEWFAEMQGKRVPPAGDRFKICTTSKGAIDHMAAYVIKHFDGNPGLGGSSISPTDSDGWCQCEKCRALDGSKGEKNIINRILTYYIAVAEEVAKKYPDKKVGAYIYGNYIYPPEEKLKSSIPPNLYLTVASSLTYGYTFYIPEVKKEWYDIIHKWSDIAPVLGYYDLPKHWPDHIGAPLAPGAENLKEIFPELKKRKFASAYIYGEKEWGHGVVYNYLMAELLWNPDLNIEEHLNDFYSKCYGEGAGDIRAMYELIDKKTKDYYLAKGGSYTLTVDMLKDIYASDFNLIEKHLFKALLKAQSPGATARIKLLGDNLVIFYDKLKQFGILSKDNNSCLNMDKKEFESFELSLLKHGLGLYIPGAKLPEIEKLKVSPGKNNCPSQDKIKPYQLRDSQELILFTPSDKLITIKIANVTFRGSLIKYTVCNSQGDILCNGTTGSSADISFDAQKGRYYYLFIETSMSFFSLSMPDIPYCMMVKKNSRGLHFIGETTPVYFYVPEGSEYFKFVLSSDSNGTGGETALLNLFDPDGKMTETLSTVKCMTDSREIRKPKPGWWKAEISKAPVGYVDDVYISVSGDKVFPCFSLEQDKLLIIAK